MNYGFQQLGASLPSFHPCICTYVGDLFDASESILMI